MQECDRGPSAPRGRLLLSTSLEREGELVGNVLQLGPDEGVIVEEV
jgi:hypothetical protein